MCFLGSRTLFEANPSQTARFSHSLEGRIQRLIPRRCSGSHFKPLRCTCTQREVFRESFHSIKSDKVCLRPKEEEEEEGGRREEKRKKTEKKSEILLLKNDQKPLKTLNITEARIQNRSAAEFRTDRTKRAAAKHTHTHKDTKTSRLSYKRHKRFLTDAPSLRLENNTAFTIAPAPTRPGKKKTNN